MPSLYATIDSLSTLPATVSRILAIDAGNADGPGEMLSAIRAEQTLCATMIKLAGSTFFGPEREISTIESAVTTFGCEKIRNSVIGKTIFTSFTKLEKDRGLDIGIFWEHAFTCGLAAKIIAEYYQMDGSSFFIAGLLHDIGKLAMFITFTDNYPLLRELSSSEYFYCTDQERKEFSISHDQVGLELTRRWMLPEQLVMAAGYHHAPAEALSHIHFPLVVQLADTLALLYSCSDVSAAEDVENIFHDFLPETASLWRQNNIPISPALAGLWFTALQEKRQSDQLILEILLT